MICAEAGPSLRVSSFESFAKMCRASFKKTLDKTIYNQSAKYGCRDCITGRAITNGSLKKLPDNVRLIEMEGKKMEFPPGIDQEKFEFCKHELPKNFAAADLKPFWKLPLLSGKLKGECPNCRRIMAKGSHGLCPACYDITKNKQGERLLAALAAAAIRLGGLVSGNKTPESKSENMPGATVNPDLCAGCGFSQSLFEIGKIVNADPDENIIHAVSARIEDLDRVRNTSAAQSRIIDELINKTKVVQGYEPLSMILREALDQAQCGKGRERHANDQPFLEQPIMIEARSVGLGFLAGQARKKILEAHRCHEDHPERAVADLLGAIVYTAALIIAIREKDLADLVKTGVAA